MCLIAAPAAAVAAGTAAAAGSTAAAATAAGTAAAAGATAAASSASTMMLASLATSVAGAGLSAFGQWKQAQSQKAMYAAEAKIAKQNQKIANAQADDAIKRGGEADIELRRRYAQTRGSQVAKLASNGVALDEGSALSVLQDTDMFEQIDSQRTRNNAQREAWGYRVQGENYAADAAMSRAAGRAVAGAAPLAIGGSLLSSAAEVSDKWLRFKAQTSGPKLDNFSYEGMT